jgi:maltose O-acetyltransferase
MRSLMFRIRRRLALTAIRCVQGVRTCWYRLLSTNRIIGRPQRLQPVQAVGNGRIVCEAGVRFGFFPSPGFLDSYAYIEARNPSSTITVRTGTSINNGFRCIAEYTSITIGKHCLLGANVEILDSDFHGLKLDERNTSKAEWSAPVILEDHVFIGSNVRILKGVRIGAGSVIANSSVVTVDIPPMVVAGGIPAKVLRAID